MALTQQDKEELFQYIVSRGQSIAGLPSGDATLTNKYLGPVIEYGSGGASGRLVRLAVSLLQGKPAMLRNEGGLIQWSVKDSNIWENLINVSELAGPPGGNPAFRKNAGNLEYKIEGADDATYQVLVSLSELTGPEGDHIVLAVQGGSVVYKQSKAPDSDFKKVFDLSDVRGDTGPAPILEAGTTTTVEPSAPAAAELVENGFDASGVKKYRLNLSIPKGRAGADGTGSGNVLVDTAGLLASKQYAFRPGQDGSANGSFVEVEIPEARADVYVLPDNVLDAVGAANSDEIFACWGGKAALLDFVKNFDATHTYVFTMGGDSSMSATIGVEYTDDDNFVIHLVLGSPLNVEVDTSIASGIASAVGIERRYVQNVAPTGSSEQEIYLSYGGSDGKNTYDIVWNNNEKFDDDTGVGRRHLAYSTDGTSIRLQHKGDGTKFLSDKAEYVSIPAASPTANGLMSKEDKVKLDELSTGGSGDDVLTLPATLVDLTNSSTSAEIQAVLEGVGGYNGLLETIPNAKSILLKASAGTGGMQMTAHYPITALVMKVDNSLSASLLLLYNNILNGTPGVESIAINRDEAGNLTIT